MKLRRIAALALCISAGGLALYADNFSFRADSMSGSMTKGRERAILTGNALVVSGSMRITADTMILSGDDFRFVECSGHITVIDKEKDFTLYTDKLFYDRKNKTSKMTGPSVMEDKKNKVVIKGDYIENDDERKIAVIQINVRILKENLSCRSEFARYDRAAKTLELSGSPQVSRDGDTYRAATIFVDIESEDITLSGSVSGTVSGDKKKKDAKTEVLPDSDAPAPQKKPEEQEPPPEAEGNKGTAP